MKIKESKKKYIISISKFYCIPEEILMGIFILETTYRRWFHRILENMFTLLSILLHFTIRRKIKNYTIGPFQMGLASLLSVAGKMQYRHCLQLGEIDIEGFRIIFRGMSFKGSTVACAQFLQKIYLREMMLSKGMDEVYRHIGEDYNGTYTYGILLEKVCNDLIS